MTKQEWIKRMTTADLAYLLSRIADCERCDIPKKCDERNDEECINHWHVWLWEKA
jgi:hypothetical protein